MVSVDEAVVASLDRNGKHFELLVDPDLAWKLKKGESVSIQSMLAVNIVFTDAKKGDKASPADVEKSFGTADIFEVAREIVLEGEVQLTTKMMRELTSQRERQVAEIIHRNAVDPRTGLPHPVDRILSAMEKARVRVDFRKPASSQVEQVSKELKRILPLSFENVKLSVMLPPEEAGKAYGFLKQWKFLKEEWTSSGHLMVELEMPKGMKGDFISRLSGMTKGNCSIKEV